MTLANIKRLRLLPPDEPRPLYVVWELTLRCDQHCRFCGTRAGRPHPDELTTAEACNVVAELAALGTLEVAIHGGEAYLRPDWLDIVRAIVGHGMECTMVTGGRGFDPALARAARDAGITAVSLSIDGTEATHDALRGLAGSHAGALGALRALRAEGVPVGANTQLNRRNFAELPAILELLAPEGIYGWQVQLMVPMGRAAEAPDLWLEPYDLLALMPTLAAVRRRADELGVAVWPGNNVGYFGPYEHLLRGGRSRLGFSSGCGGGIRMLGIEANGDIKGCSAMGSVGFVGGNARRTPLAEIWRHAPELQLSRHFSPDALWGFCRDCYYGEVCKGGCFWTAATLLGKIGNNPYCHHRALELLGQHKRERLVLVAPAGGAVRDTPRFELVLEDAPPEWVASLPG
ncbi:MAG: radical SAM protein [Myxococcales bacterium]|nr:radical SAM protein [Myxococcales bacterium]